MTDGGCAFLFDSHLRFFYVVFFRCAIAFDECRSSGWSFFSSFSSILKNEKKLQLEQRFNHIVFNDNFRTRICLSSEFRLENFVELFLRKKKKERSIFSRATLIDNRDRESCYPREKCRGGEPVSRTSVSRRRTSLE